MTEEQRRKDFIKAAHDVIKVWPGYAADKLPKPTTRTDQCLQCDLRFSQELMIEIWQERRADRGTDADFNNQLTRWKVDRIHAAELFNLGKPGEADAVDKKKKQAIEAARAKCGNLFRGTNENQRCGFILRSRRHVLRNLRGGGRP